MRVDSRKLHAGSDRQVPHCPKCGRTELKKTPGGSILCLNCGRIWRKDTIFGVPQEDLGGRLWLGVVRHETEARAYHHVFDEPDSDHVVLTWPRTIPMREEDRGWSDMRAIERDNAVRLLPRLKSA